MFHDDRWTATAYCRRASMRVYVDLLTGDVALCVD
jgi:hypothetical protein